MNIPPLRVSFSKKQIESIQSKVGEVLQSGQLTNGKYVAEFEEKFADYLGTKYAVGVNSGSSALEVSLRGVGVKNSTVIVPSNTFIATPYSVLRAEGKIIFCDTLREDLGLNPEDLKEKIREDTKAVIPVHMGGVVSSRLPEIEEICGENNLALIEDVAHAHGATLNGKKAGSLGLAGAFSFYATKVMTCGEGGIITTDDEKMYQSALQSRKYGRLGFNNDNHNELGSNFRLSEFHAIVGLEQLQTLDSMIDERKKIATMYDEKLKRIKGIKPQIIPKESESAYYKYVVFLDEKLNQIQIKKEMKETYGLVLPAEIYDEPCHTQAVFAKNPEYLANKETDTFPDSEYVCHNQLCLPIYPGLREEEIDYVISSLEKTVS